MVRLCVPVVPPTHTAECLQITAMEVCTRWDAEALLATDILGIGDGDEEGEEN